MKVLTRHRAVKILTDVDGTVITEAVSGADADVSTSTKHFKTVTQVAVDDATAGAITVGMNTSAIAVVFAGRARVKGAFIVNSGVAGSVVFRDSSDAGESGTTLLQLGTVAIATAERDVTIPAEGIVFVKIDQKTGLLATSKSTRIIFESFKEGTAPTEQADDTDETKTLDFFALDSY